MPYSRNLLSDIQSRHQLDIERQTTEKITEVRNTFKAQLDETEAQIKKIKSEMKDMSPNTQDYKELNSLLQTQINLQTSILSQQDDAIKKKKEEINEQDREFRENLRYLNEVADKREEEFQFASKNIKLKKEAAKEDIKALETQLERNKSILQEGKLEGELKTFAEERNKQLEKEITTARKKYRETEEAEKKINRWNLSSYNFGKTEKDELKNYLAEQRALAIQRKTGAMSEEDYKRQSEAIKEALSPLVAEIVNKMDGGKSGSMSAFKTGSLKMITKAIDELGGIIRAGFKTLDKSVDDAVSIYTRYNARINSRLFGDTDQTTFSDLLSDIRTDVKASPFVNQKSLIDNLDKLVESGVNYNLEQRALLMTLNDRLVPTFDALDGTFQRMIRLQQADITTTQIGAEARLLEFLNGTFKDSSYLNSMYDSVSSAISEALSTQLDTDQYTRFGFAVQKWLGALYSVGMSDAAISSIASAINLLATGDVNQLGESPAQTLLALSSQRAGLSYADLLTQGLTADNTDKLLKSMIEYLKSIADNTSSKVVRSQWGDILNLQMSDWKAIQNLTESDITNLVKTTITQKEASDTLSTLITKYIPARTHLSERLSNSLDNALISFGMSVASDTSEELFSNKYAQWEMLKLTRNMMSTIAGESSLLSNITNIVTGVLTGFKFGSDIAKIGMDLGDALLGGTDNSILNAFARNYSYTMNRGGIRNSTINNNSSAEYGISESSNNIVIPSDLQRMMVNEEEDYYIVPNETLGIRSTGDEAILTTFQQQEDRKSATLENVISNESVLSRDINDLYSELFEKQTTPIRVSIAKLEDGSKIDLSSALSGLGVNVLNEDIFYRLADMRS